MNEPKNTEHPPKNIKVMSTENANKPTGRRFASVNELMKGEGISPEVQAKVAALERESKVTLFLATLRQKAGITQEGMAEKLGITQSAISKLEAGFDDELTLREIKQYATVLDQKFSVMVGKPPTHTEAVRSHALSIKAHLESLARIANQHDELQSDIESFFSEALINILGILAKCSAELPSNGKAKSFIRIEAIKTEISRPAKSNDCTPAIRA